MRHKELSSDNSFIKLLSDIVLDNLRNEQFGVEELSRAAGFNRSQVYRKLHNILGKSGTQFIREIRLEEAYKLLIKGEETAAEISYLVGFNSPTYFNTSFNEYFGYPPGEVKKKVYKDNKEFEDVNIVPIYKEHSDQLDTVEKSKSKFSISNSDNQNKNKKVIVLVSFAIIVFTGIIYLISYLPYPAFRQSNKIEAVSNRERSMAVLPFNYDSEDQKKYFVNGVMADIHYNLSMMGNLRLISRTTMESYRDTKLSAREIAKELGVDYLLEGSVQKHDNQIKINANLIDGRSEQTIWANVYQQVMDNYFDIQKDIASQVAHALFIIMSPDESERINQVPTTSQTAYSFYVKAREEHTQYWIKSDPTNLANAINYYGTALDYDSSFAKALAGLGLAYYNKLRQDNLDDIQSPYWDSIYMYSEKAIHANDKLGEAHLLKGLYEYGKQGEIETAIQQIDLALNNFMAYEQKGFLLGRVCGKTYEAIINLTQASIRIQGKELARLYGALARYFGDMGFYDQSKRYIQLHHNITENQYAFLRNLAFLEFSNGDYAATIDLFEKNAAIDTSFYISPVYLIVAGQNDKAYRESLKYLKKTNGKPWIADLHRIGYSFWKAGDCENGLYYLNMQIEKCKESIRENSHFTQRKYSYYDLAATYAFLGEKEKAIQALNGLKNNHSYSVYVVNLLKTDDPLFDSIRDDPRFQEIVDHVEDKYLKEHERIKAWLINEGSYYNK